MAAYELRRRPDLSAIATACRWPGAPAPSTTCGRVHPSGGHLAVKGGWIDGVASMVGTLAGRRPVDFALVMNGAFDYPTALSVQTRAAAPTP